MKLIFRPEAEADVAEAYRWYSERIPTLGAEFIRSVDAAIASILRQPQAFPEKYQGVRRALLRRFPYGIFYVAEEERIVVLACFHARRDPRRLQARL
jgi:toxin ParE1/3/4